MKTVAITIPKIVHVDLLVNMNIINAMMPLIEVLVVKLLLNESKKVYGSFNFSAKSVGLDMTISTFFTGKYFFIIRMSFLRLPIFYFSCQLTMRMI